MKTHYAILSLALLLACTEDEPTNSTDLYVDRFFQEASKRGLSLDRSLFTVTFTTSDAIGGRSGMTQYDPSRVLIAKDHWDTFSDISREITMFHELGHAVLGRFHTNEKLPNCSDYKSMMFDGNQLSVYAPETYRREYYIDELFNVFIDVPTFGGIEKANESKVFTDTDPLLWTYESWGGNTHSGNLDTEIYSSAPSSYHMKATSSGGGQGMWYLKIPYQSYPLGSTLLLRLKIKTQNVTGLAPGVNFQSNLSENATFYIDSSMYGGIPLENDWTEYTYKLRCYPEDTPEMLIYVTMQGASTGDIWFDDVSVSVFQ